MRRPRILAEFPERLSAYAKQALEHLGVEVILNAPCENIDANGVTLKGGERIEAANVFWAAGTRAQPAAQWIGASAARNNAVEVTSDCSVPNHPEIFAIGDVSSFKTDDGKTLPALAPGRQTAGRLCRQGDRQPDRRPQASRAVQIHQSRHDGGDRPLARHRNARGHEADGTRGLVRLVAGPPSAADRLPQQVDRVHQLGLAYLTYGRGSRLVISRPRTVVRDSHLASPEHLSEASRPQAAE